MLGPWGASDVPEAHAERSQIPVTAHTEETLTAGVPSNIYLIPEQCWTTSLWTIGEKVAQQARALRYNQFHLGLCTQMK